MADEAAKLQAQYDSLQARIRLAREGQQQQLGAYGRAPPYQPNRGANRGRGGRTSVFQNKKLILKETTPAAHSADRSPSHPSTPEQTIAQSPALAYSPRPLVQTRTSASVLPGHDAAPKPSSPVGKSRELVIEGIRFRMKEDGSKLYRVDDPSNAALTTPKQVVISGIEFLRSKNGNLLRKTAIDATARSHTKPKPQCINFTKNGIYPRHHMPISHLTDWISRFPHELSVSIDRSNLTSRTGMCYDGPKCKYAHDPKKVAICKTYFRTGDCADGTRCDLSHKPTYERVPACTHFLNGNCTNAACRYAHVNVSPTPLVCRPFATLGFCEKGKLCDKRHVFECPDYAETGECKAFAAGKCKLQHVTRAHLERKARRDDDSEVESEDDEDSGGNDIDSDQMAEDVDMTGINNDSQAISQNQDYVAFG